MGIGVKRVQGDGGQDRPAAAFGGVAITAYASGAARPAAREFFTVDLRGLRAALAARAAAAGMTESDVLRSALAVALGDLPVTDLVPVLCSAGRAPPTIHAKLSVRLTHVTAARLDQQTRAAGLSRGVYLTRLIDGAPIVTTAVDRAAGAAALRASAAELAMLSRDIAHLTQLLRRAKFEAARPYRERLDTLDADVRRNLEQAAAVLGALSPARAAKRRSHPLAKRNRSVP